MCDKQVTAAVACEGQGIGYLLVASKAAFRVARSLHGRLMVESTAMKTLSKAHSAETGEERESSLAQSSPQIVRQPSDRLRIAVHLTSDGWCDVLRKIQDSGCTLLHMESQPSSRQNGCSADLLIDARPPSDPEAQKRALLQLHSLGTNVSIFKETNPNSDHSTNIDRNIDKPVWYPERPADLDGVVNCVLQVKDFDHPSMQDEDYQTRRKMFAQLAFDYKHDQPIPLVDYTDEENKTWSIVFNRLCELYDEHACKEFLVNFKQLREIGLYRSDRIPQLRDVSEFVKRRSGFTLRPVAGYLSARDFLSALALRVFCCTQYIRHAERPFYTPEPDCCHELLGHVPMLADPAFAHFSQEIGLASLGASDEDVKKLATCYFFTIEFGFCKEAGKLKVYGAGLLACVDEFSHAVSGRATIREFDPALVLQQECKVTTFQDMYFFTNSFPEAKEKLRHFARTLTRSRTLVYNPFTQSVEDVRDASSAAVDHLLDRICWDLETAVQVAQDLNL